MECFSHSPSYARTATAASSTNLLGAFLLGLNSNDHILPLSYNFPKSRSDHFTNHLPALAICCIIKDSVPLRSTSSQRKQHSSTAASLACNLRLGTRPHDIPTQALYHLHRLSILFDAPAFRTTIRYYSSVNRLPKCRVLRRGIVIPLRTRVQKTSDRG